MTTTIRRNTKLTTKQAQDIRLARVYDKDSGVCLGYLVQPSQPRNPDGSLKPWYEVTWERDGWHCTCPACVECKHITAVKADCAARVAAGLPGCFQGVVKDIEAPVVAVSVTTGKGDAAPKVMGWTTAQEIEAADRRRREGAPLGGNRGFSLLRR